MAAGAAACATVLSCSGHVFSCSSTCCSYPFLSRYLVPTSTRPPLNAHAHERVCVRTRTCLDVRTRNTQSTPRDWRALRAQRADDM